MDLLEIVMLIIGIAVIIISSIIVNRKPSGLDSDINSQSDVQDNLTSIRKQHEEDLSIAIDELVSDTEDYLSKLSNEKIMAVSEFSDQILDKINNNHEEVVFLYNMLNNKERELKELAKELETSKYMTKEDHRKEKSKTKDSRRVNEQAYTIDNNGRSSLDQDQDQSISINNTEILNLYSEGLSIMDISRQLGIGQGEVKLIIDLYKDR